MRRTLRPAPHGTMEPPSANAVPARLNTKTKETAKITRRFTVHTSSCCTASENALRGEGPSGPRTLFVYAQLMYLTLEVTCVLHLPNIVFHPKGPRNRLLSQGVRFLQQAKVDRHFSCHPIRVAHNTGRYCIAVPDDGVTPSQGILRVAGHQPMPWKGYVMTGLPAA